jgi:hypothetical protein
MVNTPVENGSLSEKNGYHFFSMFRVSDLPVCHKLFDFLFISEELMFCNEIANEIGVDRYLVAAIIS